MKIENIAKHVGKPVQVTWRDDCDDWPSFRVLAVDGEDVWLRGINDRWGNKHDGSTVVANRKEITSMRAVNGPDGV